MNNPHSGKGIVLFKADMERRLHLTNNLQEAEVCVYSTSKKKFNADFQTVIEHEYVRK